MKKEWQEARPRAKYVIKPIWSQKEISITMQVINRENQMIFQTKQTGKDADQAWLKASNACTEYLKDEDLLTIFWFNPYMLNCQDILTPHYVKASHFEKRDASLCKG